MKKAVTIFKEYNKARGNKTLKESNSKRPLKTVIALPHLPRREFNKRFQDFKGFVQFFRFFLPFFKETNQTL